MSAYPYRAILVLFAASALGACTSYAPFGDSNLEPARPNFPTRLPPPGGAQPPAPPPAAAEEPQPTPPPYTPPVDATPLAPPPVAVQPAPLQPVAPPPVEYQTVVRTSVGGKVVDVDGKAKSYEVEKGDTLIGIARKLDTTTEQLARDNDLEKPYLLKPGKVLKGPSSRAKAYTVTQGDTLYAIARRFSVSAQAIADENDMELGAPLRPGQKLRLPADFKDRGPTRTETRVPIQPPPGPPPAAVVAPPVTAPPPVYVPRPPPPRTEPVRPPVTPPPPPPRVEPVRPPVATPPPRVEPVRPPTVVEPTGPAGEPAMVRQGRGRFIWPLRGDIISTFGPKGTGQRNDGLNIRAVAGSPVRAAAAGDVVYAGDQVPGFGNLVLVKHAEGWVTAYGHLARIDVKMQQKVVQGQQLGQAGSSGGVGEPQLHFEVRYAPTPAERARPIDPALVLPK